MKEKEFIKKYLFDYKYESNCIELEQLQKRYKDIKSIRENSVFYRYYSLEDNYTLKNIKNDIIHFSNPNSFNDPFDSIMGLSIENILRNYIYEVIISEFEKNKSIDNDVKNGLKILFEQPNEDNIFDEIDDNGMYDDMKKGKTFDEISFEKKKKFFDDLIFNRPEIINEIKSGKLTEEQLLTELLKSKFIRKNIDNALNDYGKNIKLFSCDSLMDEIERFFKTNNLKYDFNSFRSEIENLKDEIFKEIRLQISEKIRISCFTNSYDNILMWSHYSSKHNGICVGYDFIKEPILLTNVYPILYDKKRPAISSKELIIRNGKVEVEQNKLAKLIVDSILTKSEVWKYENEWRVIMDKNSLTNDDFTYKCITSIYFGSKVSDEAVRNFLDEMYRHLCIFNLKYYKMMVDDSDYKLITKEINPLDYIK